ncbi:MAG TPA: hypothetical protein H9712_09135, partial [Candidatus Flavonifractor intestinigallinarum]|nr:hypothetical protein [Candidatus Flavonifractor intestinigallinarum]
VYSSASSVCHFEFGVSVQQKKPACQALKKTLSVSSKKCWKFLLFFPLTNKKAAAGHRTRRLELYR